MGVAIIASWRTAAAGRLGQPRNSGRVPVGGGRPPATAPGFMIYVMVDNIEATIERVIANGGEIVQPVGADAPEITARFRDPAGNVLGLHQQP